MCSQEISVIGNKYCVEILKAHIHLFHSHMRPDFMDDNASPCRTENKDILCMQWPAYPLHLSPPPSHLLQKLKTALREEQEKITTEQPH